MHVISKPLLRFVITGLLSVVALGGCGDAEPPRPSDAQLGAQMWDGFEVGAAVRPYDDCLHQLAENTRPQSDLGLERIETVLAGCVAQERTLIAAVERTWSKETQEELDGRIRGIRIVALQVIKDTPYVPPVAVVSP